MKLMSVLRDVHGKSARRLLDRVAANEPLNQEDVSQLLHRSLIPKPEEITLSVEGIVTPL